MIDPNENIQDHENRIHEINTLEWDELVVPEDPNKLIALEAGNSFVLPPVVSCSTYIIFI